MKKIILISLGVLILLVGGVSLYMSLLDWNEHKGRIAMQFSSVVGENIEFGGDLKVSLFPHPKMSAKSVSVVNPQTGETLATVKQLNMAVTLSSVLRGTPDVQSLTMEGVELWLKFDKNGKSNWERQVAAQQSALNDVRVQVLYIRDGIVHIENQTYGWALDLTDFAAEVQAEALDRGPYQIAGNFMYEKERYGLALSIDSMLQLDDVGFHVRLRHSDTDGKLMYDAVYNRQTGNIKGSLSGELTQTADTVNKFLQKDLVDDKYNIPMQFSAKEFDLEGDIVNLSGLTIKLDPYFVGTGDLSFSRLFTGEQPKTFALKYQIVDMDLRPVIAWLKEMFDQYGKEAYVPDNLWSGTFDISAGRLRVSDNNAGFLANVGVKGEWKQNTLNIDDFYADGQGEVDITASGTLAPQHEMPEAMMILAAQGEDFKTFFQTLNVDLQAPISNAYRKGKLNAEIKLNPKELAIDNIRMVLDNAGISGQVQVLLAQKKYDINIETENLNFDTYIFPLKEEEARDMRSVLQHDARALAFLQGSNIEIVAHMINSTFRGVPVKDAVLKASYENAELMVEKLTLQEFMGANVDAAAAFKKLDTDMPEVETLSLNAKAQDLRVLADKFGIPLPKWKLFGQKNSSVAASISGNYEKIQTKTVFVSEGDVLAYEGALDQKDGHFYFDGLVEVKTQRLESLLPKVNINIKDSKVFRGVFNGVSQVKGTADKYVLNDAEFKIGAAQYSGNLNVEKRGERYFLNGNIDASELNFAQILGAQKVAARNTALRSENTFFARPNFGKATFDFSAYNGVDFDIKLSAGKGFYESFSLSDFKCNMVNAAQQLNIKDAEFVVGAMNVRGNAVIEYAQVPHINGNISISKWPIKKAGGSVYAITAGEVDLTGNFDGSIASFEDLLGSLSGKLTMNTQEVMIYGINLGAIAEDLKVREYSKGLFQVVQKNLQSGSTKFEPLKLNVPVKDGVIALDGIMLQNSSETAMLNGKVNLRDWRINADMQVKYKKLPNIEAYKFALTGALNNPALDISIVNIVRAYDEHWLNVAADEQARKAEAERELNANMNQAQDEVAALAAKHTAAVALIDRYSGKNLAADTARLYVEQNRRLDEIGRDIQNMQNTARQAEFSDSDIDAIKRHAAILQSEIEGISKKVNEYFADDLQQAMDEVHEKVAFLQNKYGNVYDEFNQMLNDDRRQLQLIGAEQYMTNNAALQQYKASMEASNQAILQEVSKFNAKYAATQKMAPGGDKLASIHAMSAVPTTLETEYKKMQEVHTATADLLLDIINQRQAAYRLEQMEIEKKRQKEAAENAGNLLLEGVSVYDNPVVKNETENNELQKNTAEDVVKQIISPEDYRTLLPLQDNREVPTTGGILIRSMGGKGIYVEPVLPQRLLTPLEGEAPATSGYIIVR